MSSMNEGRQDCVFQYTQKSIRLQWPCHAKKTAFSIISPFFQFLYLSRPFFCFLGIGGVWISYIDVTFRAELSFFSLGVCLCVYCMYIWCMHVWVWVCTSLHTYVEARHLSLYLFTSFSWDRLSHWTRTLTFQLSWLWSSWGQPACCMWPCQFFFLCWYLGSELILMLHSQCSYSLGHLLSTGLTFQTSLVTSTTIAHRLLV